jgi:hypothetical protein
MSQKNKNSSKGCIALILIGIGVLGSLALIVDEGQTNWFVGPFLGLFIIAGYFIGSE